MIRASIKFALSREQWDVLDEQAAQDGHSRVTLASAILADYLSRSNRKRFARSRSATIDVATPEQIAVAEQRLKLITRWRETLVHARRRRSLGASTRRFLDALPTAERVSKRTLYLWWGRFRREGFNGLLDGRRYASTTVNARSKRD